MRLVGYVRQSKEKEGGLSPESQRAEIEHWASAPGKDRQIVKWLSDLDTSGKSLDRPAVQEALALVRSGEAHGIVVTKLDRLTRSVSDLNALIKEAQGDSPDRPKWTIIALDLGVDLLTSNGKMFAGIIAVIAEWYLDRLREETTRTIRHKINVDGAHWGAPPLGYKRGKTVNERGQSKPGALIVDEKWAPAVQEVFRRRALPNGERGSWGELARYLTEVGAPGIRERASGKKATAWRDTSVRSVIENKVYLGEARAGKLVRKNAHPALVDETTFRRANRKEKTRPGERKGGPLLGGGMLRCGSCGSALYKSSDAKRYFFYRCRAAGCPTRTTISARKIEEYLVGLAWDRFEGFDYEVAAQPHVDLAQIEAKLEQIDADIAEVEADETLSEYRRAQALTALDAEREKLLDTLTEAGTVVKHIGPEYLGVLFHLKGDYGLRKEPTPDDGYQWVSDPEAEGHWLDNLGDVKACREFLRKMLGEQVTVLSVNGSKTVPVEERVRLAAA
jgi:DNA invertase Pin-like site-specific DNA recombinase